MNPENMVPSERRRHERTPFVGFHLCEMPRRGKSWVREVDERLPEAVRSHRGRGRVRDCSWVQGSFWGDENVLNLDHDDGSRTLNPLLNCTL